MRRALRPKCDISGPPLKDAKPGSVARLVVLGPGGGVEEVKVARVEGSDIYIEGYSGAFSRHDGKARDNRVKGLLVMLDEDLVSL